MRRRRLKRLWKRLQELQRQKLTRDELLLKLGAAKAEAGKAYRLVEVQVPKAQEPVNAETFTFSLRKEKLRAATRAEGHYLLRSNLSGKDPAMLWQRYIQLTEIEAVFRNLKSDLAVRPISPQNDARIEAHIFVAFLAYCLYVTLQQRLRAWPRDSPVERSLRRCRPSRWLMFTCQPPTAGCSFSPATRNRSRISNCCCSASISRCLRSHLQKSLNRAKTTSQSP